MKRPTGCVKKLPLDANIIIGTAFDETLNGSIRVSVVVTGLDEFVQKKSPEMPASRPEEAVASKQSLAGRLDEVNAGHREVAAGAGQAVGVPGMQAPQAAPSCEAAVHPADTHYGDELRGATDPERSFEQEPFVDMAVRMPTMEDFSPVGQALLRDQDETLRCPQPARGLETYKERTGFFERLAMLAGGPWTKGHTRQSVADQPQVKMQSAPGQGESNPAFVDPHVKGEALSQHLSTREGYATENTEDIEFPSFLRKNG